MTFTISSSRSILGAASLLLALPLSSSIAQDQIQIPGLRESVLGALKGTKFERPRVGRTVVQSLQEAKQYTNFLKIVERAGLVGLLDGTVPDSTRPTIEFVQDSVGGIDANSSNFTFSALPPGMSATEAKAQVIDKLRDAAGDVMTALIAEPDRVTVFIPTDAALAKLPKERLDALLTDAAAAREFVRAHVVNRGVYRDAFGKIRTMSSLGGPVMKLARSSKGPTVNGTEIVEADIAGDNGVAHGIDGVLEVSSPAKTTP